MSHPSVDRSAAGSRRPFVAANWKMNKSNAEADAFLRDFLRRLGPDVDVAICAPFTALQTVARHVAGTGVIAAAQNMHAEESGAFTGEVSAPMLIELGVRGVVLGHSERRELFCESDAALQRKVAVALEVGLTPILCVGETEAEREARETERKLRHQVQADLADIAEAQLDRVVIAYEPIWAIGTGNTATADQAQEAIAFVRALLADRSEEAAARTRVLYGGNVHSAQPAQLLRPADLRGA